MSGIYIPGMETPKRMGVNVTTVFDAQINVYGDGTASIDVKSSHDSPMVRFSLIPVQDHGRLIDADALLESEPAYTIPNYNSDGYLADAEGAYTEVQIENAPTIIPADKEVVPSDR